MNRIIIGVLALFLAFSILPCWSSTLPSSNAIGELSVGLSVGSQTAVFTIHVPHPGVFTLSSLVKGKKGVERLWGPNWTEAGAFRITLPKGVVENREGVAELFTLDLKFKDVFGRAGRGERQFIKPMGFGWDPVRKEIFVADTGNDRVVKLSADGKFMTQYGGFGVAFKDDVEQQEECLDEPFDIAPGGFSNFYVSDQNNDRVCEFDAYRSFKGRVFPGKNERFEELDRPRGIVVDGENNIWVVDGRGDRILKVSPGGQKLFELGGFGWSAWKFKEPTQVAVDPEGRIFVCDRGNHRVGVFDKLGSFIREIHDHLKNPVGVAVDPDGLVAICDEGTGELGFYTLDGRRITFVGNAGGGPKDRFRSPADIIALDEVVYLLDSGNNRIVVFEKRRDAKSCTWQALPAVVK